MQSSDELERLRSEIDDLKKDIKVATNSEERITMRNLLLTLEQRVNILMQGASMRNS